ncbi:MAG: polyprenyl synthetase family protein [Bdellovibrionaceae bacterium]|nr:polyprenyl synthetase family protein [Pseudobdellovibrionaceae bacterium]
MLKNLHNLNFDSNLYDKKSSKKKLQQSNLFAIPNLLDKKDLRKQPLELIKICEKIFSKGKRLRAHLVSFIGHNIGLDQKENIFLSRIIEYIHNSSLLHDDFIDHSKIRRQNKTAWFEFSPAQAVLAGDYLIAKVNIYLAQQKNLSLINKTATVISELAKGEFLQREVLYFKNKDLKQRDKISEFKTASLFKWCLQSPFIYKNRYNLKLEKLLNQIGLYMGLLFQRSDDLMDFNVRNKDKKNYLVDIKQKHFNSFACFLLKNASKNQQKKLQTVRSASAVYKIFPNFKDQIKNFDNINYELIKKTELKLEKLQLFLTKKEQKLIPHLKRWTNLLYWRK